MVPKKLIRLYLLMLDGAKIINHEEQDNIYTFVVTIPRDNYKDEDVTIGLQYARYGRTGHETEIILGPDTKEFYKWMCERHE